MVKNRLRAQSRVSTYSGRIATFSLCNGMFKVGISSMWQGKSKGKVTPRTGHEDPEVE